MKVLGHADVLHHAEIRSGARLLFSASRSLRQACSSAVSFILVRVGMWQIFRSMV